MNSQIFTIDDLLLGKTREVRIYVNELVLTPDYINGFRPNPISVAYLGVVENFGELREQPFVRLNPFYKLVALSGDLSKIKIQRWNNANSLYANFFKTIFTGPSDAIAQALIDGPFSNMEQLAVEIKKIQLPYNASLADFLEKRVSNLAMTG